MEKLIRFSNIFSLFTNVFCIICKLTVFLPTFFIFSFWHEKSFDVSSITNEKTPILFIHGSHSNQHQWFFFRNFLSSSKIGHIFTMNLYKSPRWNNHNKDIHEYAEIVRKKVLCMRKMYAEAGYNMNEIIIVASSMGGLVAGAYCANLKSGDPVVKVLTTLCTPWNGCVIADKFCNPKKYPQKYFMTNDVERKMLVEKLMNVHKHRPFIIYNYASNLDWLVPVSRAILPLSKEFIKIDSHNDHITTMIDWNLAEHIKTHWMIPHTDNLPKFLD